MKSSVHLKLRVVMGIAGLVVISAVAVGMPESPRLWVICGLVALLPVGLLWTSLQLLRPSKSKVKRPPGAQDH